MQDFFTIFSDFISIFETFFRSGKLLKIDALYDPWVLYKVVHSITCTCTPPFRELLRVPSGMDFDFRHYPDLGSTSDWWRQIFNQSEEYYPDLGSDTSSVWNFCSRFSDVTSRRNQWWRREMLVVFSGYAGSVTSGNAKTFDARIMAERFYVRVTEINVQRC